MLSAVYFIFPVVAIIVHLIINKDIIFSKPKGYPFDSYKMFLYSVLVFFICDAIWGLASLIDGTIPIYIATIFYYTSMAASITLWSIFVADFLNHKNTVFGKIFKILAMLVSLFIVILLVVNNYKHIFFWFVGNGEYVGYMMRNVVYYILIGFLACSLVWGLYYGIVSDGASRKRNIAIASYCLIMILAIIIQILFPFFPVFSIGYLVGSCLLHSFIEETYKQEYMKKLKDINETLEKNNKIFGAAGYGLWSIYFSEKESKKMYANEVLLEILGVKSDVLSPIDLYKYYHSKLDISLDAVEDDYKKMGCGEIKSRLLCWNHQKKGKIYLRAGGTVTEVSDKGFVISGYCGDVTTQKLEEDILNGKLAEAVTRSEAASKAKTSFLFNMSHDIRTPMNAIIGYTELMMSHFDNKELTHDYLTKIDSSSRFLLSLLNNILEMARIESGKTELSESLWNCDEFNDDICGVFQNEMKKKNITFTKSIDVVHKNVMCDATKLREVFLNIISNAVKYTPENGKINMILKEIEPEKEGYATYRTWISDTGIGMSKEFLPHIFDEFSRERNTSESKIGGTGLGMPIVKSLLDIMDGRIEVESEKGKGSTFIVTISHKIVTEEELKNETKNECKVSNYSIEGLKILLVEDNELNLEIAKTILEDAGATIVCAENGKIAIDKLMQEQPTYFDLILMDVQMPVIDGYTATKMIRSMNNEYSNIPIIAMTANAFEEDKKIAMNSGMNDHVSKPINVAVLLKTICNIIKKK